MGKYRLNLGDSLLSGRTLEGNQPNSTFATFDSSSRFALKDKKGEQRA